jgi:hypothetical protein
MNFEETPQYKKGLLGEEIVRDILRNKGWITYKPDAGKAHYFDILATKNKESIIAIDVKTKARFNKWAAQGIDLRHYNEYMSFVKKTLIPFYLIFVDDKTGEIHAANLNNLKNEFYPRPNIIAWPLSEMVKIGSIDIDLIEQLSLYDTRKYSFKISDL